MQLLSAGRVLANGLEQELRVYLNDCEEIIQLVGDETRGPVCFFEVMSPGCQIADGRLLFVLPGVAGGLFQDSRPRSVGRIRSILSLENN